MADFDFEKNLKCLKESFEIENIQIGNSTLKNLRRLFKNKETGDEIIERLKIKYTEKA